MCEESCKQSPLGAYQEEEEEEEVEAFEVSKPQYLKCFRGSGYTALKYMGDPAVIRFPKP